MPKDRIIKFRTVEDYARKGQPVPQKPARFDAEEAIFLRGTWQGAIVQYHGADNLPGGIKHFLEETVPQEKIKHETISVRRLIGKRRASELRRSLRQSTSARS